MAPPPFRRGQARTPADDSFSSSNPSNSPPSGSSRRSGPQVTPSTPSRLSTVHERPIGGSSASSPSTRPRVANSSGSTAAPASKQAPQPPKKKTLRRKILAYIHQRINFSGHSDSDTITVLDRGYNASRDQTCQDVAAKQSAPRWRQAQGTVVSQSGIAATSQLFASGQTPIAYTPPRIVTPPILSRSPSPPSSPTPPPSLEAHRDLKDAERAMLVSGDTNLLSSSTEFGPGELAHTVRLLQKSMEKKDKEVEELQRKVEKLNREVERLNRNREEMVTWSNSVVQELSTWGEAQATHLATKEDVMRRDFEKMFDEAMERRTRELAVMRKESRILTWFSLALEISKANNPNLRGKDNSTISLPDLEKEVSNVNKAKFRMKHGKFGTALCLARRC
ncbi:hypothetical protein EHS25_009318 [Saitozyma podzolica]|uniref:Uncharacterized protein n=1 Tax=Saitozyma podzolica TaxID=1890683 RepID=A0A427YLF1_9TREE|nr:hypothetical protein EHS25_009318 [Saitozyma podzolica]